MGDLVLIIEDDRDISEAVAYSLRQEGFEVATAHDGRDGRGVARGRTDGRVALGRITSSINPRAAAM